MTAPIRPAATFQRAPHVYDERDQNELRRSIAQIIDTVTVATGISGLTASILALPTIAAVTADDTLIVNDGATTPSLATAAVLRDYILQISGGTATIAEHLSLSQNLTVTGVTALNGNMTFGNAASDTITATGRFASVLTPSTANTRDLGDTSLPWRSGYFGTSMGIGFTGAISTDVNLDVVSKFGIRPSSSYSYPTVLAQGFAGRFYAVHDSGDWGFVIARSANDTLAANLTLYHTRSTTGARTVLTNGDLLGRITFQGVSQTSGTVNIGASIIAITTGAISNGVLPTELRFYAAASGDADSSLTGQRFTIAATAVTVNTALSVTGNTTLGDATSDTITFTGRMSSAVEWTTDNSLDIGASGANRPRRGYFGTELLAPTVTATSLGGTLTTVTQNNVTTMTALTTIGTLVAGAVPASLVTAGTFGAGAYVFPSTLQVTTTLLSGVATHATGSPRMTLGGGTIQLVLAENMTDATQKVGRLGFAHYTNSEEPVAGFVVDSLSTTTGVYIGGGSVSMNAATFVRIYTAANNTTTTGTIRASWDAVGTFAQVGNATIGGTLGVTGAVTGGTYNGQTIANASVFVTSVSAPTLIGTTRVTSPLLGTTTATDVVFDRNSVTQLTLGSLAATFAGTVSATGLTSPTLTNAGTLALSATGANSITAATNGTTWLTLNSSGQVTHAGSVVELVQIASAGNRVTVGSNTATSTVLCLNAAVETSVALQYQRGGTGERRWNAQMMDGAESGSNAGSDFAILSYTDGSVNIDAPFQIVRAANGAITLGGATAGGTLGKRQVIIDGTGYGAGVASLRLNGLTTGAGAGAGTLTNAPSAGDPNFWIPVSIAGTVRYIPAW